MDNKPIKVFRQTVPAESAISAVPDIKMRIPDAKICAKTQTNIFIIHTMALGSERKKICEIHFSRKMNIPCVLDNFSFGRSNFYRPIRAKPPGRHKRRFGKKRENNMRGVNAFVGKSYDLAIGAQKIFPRTFLGQKFWIKKNFMLRIL